LLLANMTSVTEQMVETPPDADWLMWRRTLDELGYSPLTNISQANVAGLTLSWAVSLSPGTNGVAPLVHDGVMFLNASGKVMALGLSQLKAYLAPLKVGVGEPEPLVRFETQPGEQMQADFTYVRRGRYPLLAFVATLGYSRASYVRFTVGEDTQTLCACLRESLIYFGGVPAHVLLDNPKTVVIERDCYGEGQHRFNRELLALAEEFGFRPRLCRPYRAKTKGKVERFNGYLKGSFLVPLAATLKQAGLKLDLTAANSHIGPWLQNVANARVHGTTGEVPNVRLQLEREKLQALPISVAAAPPIRVVRGSVLPMPYESLQHPLSVYDSLLEVA
jgi:hypothetical protein